MRKTRRVLFIIVALLLIVMVACGDKDSNDKKDNNTANNTTNNAANNDVENEENNNAENNTNTENSDVENLNLTDMPIVNEPITLKMFAGMSKTTKNNWDDILIWNHYEDMTGIHVEFEQTSDDSLVEKRNLMLASGTLPDVLYAAHIPPLDLLKYGAQGTFIPLNDLIEQYAPNLTALMEESPDIRKALTFPDGNIYSFPWLVDPDFTSLLSNPLPFINGDNLEKFGIENPETLDEFYDYLVMVKEDGEVGEVPLGVPNINYLFYWLKGSYDVGNTSRNYIDKDPESGDIRFYPTADNYKEMLEFTNKLFEEGLIEQNVFSIEWDQFLANGAEGKYASTVFYSPEELFGKEAGSKYVGGTALEGPYGDRMWVNYNNPVFDLGKFAITNVNEHPEASVRWVDYFYSDEGSQLWYMGIEGETFDIDEDGNYVYVDKIIDSPEGLTKEQELSKYLGWVGLGAPGILKQEYFDGSEGSEQPMATSKALEPYLIEESWPTFTYTEEESKVLLSAGSDIEKYVDEMRDKFIAGDTSFSEWDAYVETLEKMGLEDYMEIQSAAYERYNKN